LDFIYVSVHRVFTKWFYIDGNWHEEAVEEFEEEQCVWFLEVECSILYRAVN